MAMTLDYTLTRDFRWRWFGPASVLGAFIVLVFLIIVNIPLTGYETIVTFQDDFNAIDSMWFYSFMPFRRPVPGTLCEPHLFRVGDSYTTNNSLFVWTIDTISKANAGTSAISYSGTPLTFCDVSSVYLNGDLRSWSADFTVVVACNRDEFFNVTAKTFFSMAMLPGRYSPLLGSTRQINKETGDARGAILDDVIRRASQDLGERVYRAFVRSNRATPAIVSLEADFAFCPMSLGLAAECAINPPKFYISSAAVVYDNATVISYDGFTDISDSNPYILDGDTETPVYNILQAVYAAIRIDLGNPSPNNFLLNRSSLNQTIYHTFPATQWNPEILSRASSLYDLVNNPPPRIQRYLPITRSGPARVQLVYPCRFQQPKYLGPLIISVTVATLSMFSTAWAIYISLAAALAKRQDAASNMCEGHSIAPRRGVEPSNYDAYGFVEATDYQPPATPTSHEYKTVS